MKNTNILFITGGLGNQLFQLAYGLSVTHGQLLIDPVHGHPRNSKSGVPDLLEFTLPSNTTVCTRTYSNFISRVLGYNLRLGIIPNKVEKIKIFKFFVNLVSSAVISLHYRRKLKVRIATGVGFDPDIDLDTTEKIIIGYFQSFMWLRHDDVKTLMQSIRPRNPSNKFLQLLSEISAEPTLILHLRLGDYLHEPAFGTPDPKYFQEGLTRLQDELGNLRVWAFSDQPELGRLLLETDVGINLSWVDDEGLTSSETLELMRHGAGFLMANSTFSWWAAMLRHNESAPVIAPTPWFKDMEEPYLLIPPEWIRIEAYHNNLHL
jgi:hypothetical protein